MQIQFEAFDTFGDSPNLVTLMVDELTPEKVVSRYNEMMRERAASDLKDWEIKGHFTPDWGDSIGLILWDGHCMVVGIATRVMSDAEIDSIPPEGRMDRSLIRANNHLKTWKKRGYK